MKRFALALCAALVVGCDEESDLTKRAVALNSVEWTPIGLTAPDRMTIDRGVRLILRDPASALFGKEFATTKGGDVAACGFVNARNSLGGMAGMAPYYGLLTSSQFAVIAVDPSGTYAKNGAISWCKERGISLE